MSGRRISAAELDEIEASLGDFLPASAPATPAPAATSVFPVGASPESARQRPVGSFKPVAPAEAKAAQVPREEAWLSSVGGKRYDVSAMASRMPEPMDWVFPGLKAGTVKSLISTGGVGKSFLTLGLAASIVTSVDVLGLFEAWGETPRDGRVVFFALEDDEETIHHRVFSIARDQPGRFLDSIFGLEIIGVPGGFDLANPACEAAVADICVDARLVVFDTLRMTHEGEENSSGDMKIIMAALTRIAAASGAGVLFLHHTNKMAALNGDGDQQHAARGSSVIVDNTRGSFFLQSMTQEEAALHGVREDQRGLHIRFGMGKENLGARWKDFWLKRDPTGVPRHKDLRETPERNEAPAKGATERKAHYKGTEIRL